MRRLRAAARHFVAFALLALFHTPLQAAMLKHLSLNTTDGTREYILSVPDGAAASPLPLVLVLHGHLGTADNAFGGGLRPSPLSAWLAISQREQALVAALQGLKGSDDHTGWRDCRVDATHNPNVDDVAFADAVVRQLVASEHADAKRVYVMGMSNGGMMAYRLALQMQPAPAAIAAVSSSMAQNSACAGAPRKVSVLMINGTADPIVPFAGGAVGTRQHNTGAVIGANATRDWWLKANGLSATPVSSAELPHLDADHATRVSQQIFGTAGGPQVETFTIQGGGHVEPSLRFHYGALYYRLVGAQNRDFESAEAAWAFFKGKP